MTLGILNIKKERDFNINRYIIIDLEKNEIINTNSLNETEIDVQSGSVSCTNIDELCKELEEELKEIKEILERGVEN